MRARRARCHSFRNLFGALVVAGVIAHARPAWSQSHPQWQLKLEGGSEYDSNVHRFQVEGDAPTEASPLLRTGARLRVAWRPSSGQRLDLAAIGGAKLFATDSAQDENVVVVASDGRYRWRLGARSATLAVGGRYYDAIPYQVGGEQMLPGRNFRIGDGTIELASAGPGEHRVIAHAGYRWFEYKPDEDFDWAGGHYGLRYRTTLWRGDPDVDLDAAAFDLDVAYRLEQRAYQGRAFSSACPDGDEPSPRCFSPTRLARADLNHLVSAELVYTGDQVLSARYELQANDSNSYGQSLVRQRLEVGITTELAARLYLTAKATVLVNLFLDPLLLAQDVQSQTFTTIEDENRNAISIHVSRDVGERWAVEGRYAFYAGEFATETLRFRRQVVYLGAVYNYR